MLFQQVNPDILSYISARQSAGKNTFALCGGRRSGKTFCVMQFLMSRALDGDVSNVASMTAEQGRLGAFADCQTIVRDSDELQVLTEIVSVPRELRVKGGDGKIVFNSYQNPETAKGVACDWLFVNEANNFSKQQYIDLLANVRKGVFIDYNPNIKFWVEDYFSDNEICHTTWKNNPYLTPLQLEYFNDLKRQAEKPNASPVEIRNYNVYYLGIHSEIRGKIFFESHFTFIDALPEGLKSFAVFCDPSALRGADWFACVLSAVDSNRRVYIIDTFSINAGSRDIVIAKLQEWLMSYDRVRIYVESNGNIGLDFIDYCRSRNVGVEPYCNRCNKVERIVANFQNMSENMSIVRHLGLDEFMSQIYDFDERCDHDDNIDAVNSSYNLQTQILNPKWH